MEKHVQRKDKSEKRPFKTLMSLRVGPGFSLRAYTGLTTVSYLQQYYKIPPDLNGNVSTGQSVFQTSQQYFSQGDLSIFQSKNNLVSQPAVVKNGYVTASCALSGTPNCDEGNLDTQYIMGVSQLTTTLYWYEPDYTSWLIDIANDPNPPTVNSMSWGSIEQTVSKGTLDSFNTEAMKLAAIGVTLLISSGDNGISNWGCKCSSASPISPTNCACNANSGSSANNAPWTGAGTWTGTGYFPSFPASSPWVTAVGATMGAGGDAPDIGKPEIVCQSQGGGVITSGGGFSSYFKRPTYQNEAVQGFFNRTGKSNTVGYNPNGRGLPDISLNGVAYQVYIAGAVQSLYGTSASAPVLAAFVSLVNAIRMQNNNLTSVGFLNPTLYAASTPASSFNDVTSGNIKCCASQSSSGALCCNTGFSAVPGWDPTTGFGSIDFTEFSALFNHSVTFVPTDDTVPGLFAFIKPYYIGLVAVAALMLSCVLPFYFCFRHYCCGIRSTPPAGTGAGVGAGAASNHPNPAAIEGQ